MHPLRGSLLVSGCIALIVFVGRAEPASSAGKARSCRVAQLGITVGPRVSPKTGQEPLSVVLRNRGAQRCALDGYPRVTLVDARGTRLPFRVSHRGDQMVTARPPGLVVIARRRTAFFVLNKYRCDRGDLSVPKTLEVGLPGTQVTSRLVLALRKYPILAYCGKNDPGSIVTVSPIVSRLGAAFSR